MMLMQKSIAIAAMTLALLLAGCDRNDTATERAVEGTQDALDMREHEKLKDAGEDAADAMDNAAEGIRDETDGR